MNSCGALGGLESRVREGVDGDVDVCLRGVGVDERRVASLKKKEGGRKKRREEFWGLGALKSRGWKRLVGNVIINYS